MKSIQFDFSLPRYILAKTFGKLFPFMYWNSSLSCLKYRTVDDLSLPNGKWVKLQVKYGGICGSDMNLIFLHDSPATSPFTSFPFTLGHEMVGKVVEVGAEVEHVQVGDRVVVDPVLSCQVRGIPEPCPACQRGEFSLCQQMTEGDISPGLLIGACRDTGGSWSSQMVAHGSQVFKLPEEVDDLNGVMVEPFSCALHSVLRNPPREEDTVLVIGAGVIGICIVAAIRSLQLSNKIVVLAKHSFQAELATMYGADQVIRLTKGSSYEEEMAQAFKGRLLKPIIGPSVMLGGADQVYECVGRSQSINDALRFTRSGGKVILLGLASIMDKIDWTTVWLNELEVKGSFAYSTENYQNQRRRTLDIAIELMQTGKVDLSPLITHQFPLEQYKDALKMITHKKSATMKVLFEP